MEKMNNATKNETYVVIWGATRNATRGAADDVTRGATGTITYHVTWIVTDIITWGVTMNAIDQAMND